MCAAFRWTARWGGTLVLMTTTPHPPPGRSDPPVHRPRREHLRGLLTGALAAVVGLLPWLATGARLPLQNLWAQDTLPAEMPRAALPISQYEATTILALLVIGAALAGAVTALRRRRTPLAPVALWPVLTGLALVQLAAVAQSFVVLARGLGLITPPATSGTAVLTAVDDRATLYLAGMLGGTLVCLVLGLVVTALLAHRSAAVVALGVGLVAVPLASWVVAWPGVTDVGGGGLLANTVVRWLPAVVVGLALGWCELRRRSHAVVWALDLALLWLLPATLTALTYAMGMRVLDGDLREMAAAAAQIFPLVLRESARGVMLALAIAVTVVLVRRGRLTRRDAEEERVR